MTRMSSMSRSAIGRAIRKNGCSRSYLPKSLSSTSSLLSFSYPHSSSSSSSLLPTITLSPSSCLNYIPSRSFGNDISSSVTQTSSSPSFHNVSEPEREGFSSLEPRELVAELDRYIIGQQDAKRAVAVAMRNRWRRMQLKPDLRDDVTPKNILMIGPTGCGKTEIARRIAKVTDCPFIKVEATKYTEVGFHGRDVDTMIIDLVRLTTVQLKNKKRRLAKATVTEKVEQKILDALVGVGGSESERANYLSLLRDGALENQLIEIEVNPQKPTASPIAGSDDPSSPDPYKTLFFTPGPASMRKELRKVLVSEARKLLEESELDNQTSEDFTRDAIAAVEKNGIVFIDEIDKICSDSSSLRNADASAEGVQRDLLPLLEGTTISTKMGDIQTEHILFIASGAFHSSKPSDLLAEIQGRLPIRVELKALDENELYRVLVEPKNNLIAQQIALFEVEGVTLQFEPDSIRELARTACQINRSVENIGARRLHTVVERVVEEYSFNLGPATRGTTIVITKEIVQERVKDLMKSTDLMRFLL